MNKDFLEILLNWPKPYILGTDLHLILNKSQDSRQAIIKRTISKEFLTPIRKDLYLVKNSKRHLLDTFELSGLIYGPSYVSFEAALSYHGWIPEAVRTTTCATVKRSRIFDTPLGMFSYEHIPLNAFSMALEQHKKETFTLFIASPFKAIADLIYCRKKKWSSWMDLVEDLRIEEEYLEKESKKVLVELIENYPSNRVQAHLSALLKDMPS